MKPFRINSTEITSTSPSYIIAEISCNHEGDIDEAKAIIKAAASAGANAVKLQTYTPNTITRDFNTKPKGTIWAATDLHSLYSKSYTPWEWYGELQQTADAYGLDLFSSPFDETAVDFLMEQDVPVLKVASFEVVDTKLLEAMAKTGKPIIISTGMTNYHEIREALDVLERNGAEHIAVLHCNSGYPASFHECNLNTIPVLSRLFGHVVGLSDHTIFADEKHFTDPLPHVSPLEAIKLGASIIEVHLTLDRDRGRDLQKNNIGGFDWAFSRNPDEFAYMVKVIRDVEAGVDYSYESDVEKRAATAALGHVNFEPTEKEIASRALRPSLWVTEDIRSGERLEFAGGRKGNVDSIRPGGGLHIRYADVIDGAIAAHDITAGTPLDWPMFTLKSQE